MTEAEWLTCGTPAAMVEAVREKASDRKLRLLVCACSRRVWQFLSAPAHRQAVEVAELYVDGFATEVELQAAADAAIDVTDFDGDTIIWNQPGGAALICAITNGSLDTRFVAYDNFEFSAVDALELASGGMANRIAFEEADRDEKLWDKKAFEEMRRRLAGTEERAQSELLRDIFGNPFRPVAFDPLWRSEAAVGIARGIYEDRAFERMPILADALQEAGCEHPDILTHCREPGEHVRGCWVVDLVLGKE